MAFFSKATPRGFSKVPSSRENNPPQSIALSGLQCTGSQFYHFKHHPNPTPPHQTKPRTKPREHKSKKEATHSRPMSGLARGFTTLSFGCAPTFSNELSTSSITSTSSCSSLEAPSFSSNNNAEEQELEKPSYPPPVRTQQGKFKLSSDDFQTNQDERLHQPKNSGAWTPTSSRSNVQRLDLDDVGGWESTLDDTLLFSPMGPWKGKHRDLSKAQEEKAMCASPKTRLLQVSSPGELLRKKKTRPKSSKRPISAGRSRKNRPKSAKAGARASTKPKAETTLAAAKSGKN